MRDTFALKFEEAIMYCYLMYSADSIDDIAKQLNEAARRASMSVGEALVFLNIALANLLAENPSLVTDPVPVEYKHYLERILRRAPHMLSETE